VCRKRPSEPVAPGGFLDATLLSRVNRGRPSSFGPSADFGEDDSMTARLIRDFSVVFLANDDEPMKTSGLLEGLYLESSSFTTARFREPRSGRRRRPLSSPPPIGARPAMRGASVLATSRVRTVAHGWQGGGVQPQLSLPPAPGALSVLRCPHRHAGALLVLHDAEAVV